MTFYLFTAIFFKYKNQLPCVSPNFENDSIESKLFSYLASIRWFLINSIFTIASKTTGYRY